MWLATDRLGAVPAAPPKLSLYIIRVSLPPNLNSHLQAKGQELHVMAERVPHMLHNQQTPRLTV